jgi:hypothetical protein
MEHLTAQATNLFPAYRPLLFDSVVYFFRCVNFQPREH